MMCFNTVVYNGETQFTEHLLFVSNDQYHYKHVMIQFTHNITYHKGSYSSSSMHNNQNNDLYYSYIIGKKVH